SSIMSFLTHNPEQFSPFLKNEWTSNGQYLNCLNYFFGRNDFPEELVAWRENFDDNWNAGLALRWSVASNSMIALSQFSEDEL
ncbi:MAG: hypothetical protein ACPG80_02290, partial [Rickettsiales bacterium]